MNGRYPAEAPFLPVRRHSIATLILAGLLLYGGLFPLHGWHAGNAIAFLAERQHVLSSMDDLLVNVLVFMPLGFSACLALNRRYRLARSLLLAVMLGGVLSFAIEAFQAFLPMRYSSLTDVVMNTLGSALGAGAGGWYRTRAHHANALSAGHWFADARARLVLIAWGAWALAPLLPLNPVTEVARLREHLQLLAAAPTVAYPWSLGSTTVEALAIAGLGMLWRAVSLPAARMVAALLLPVLARVLVGDHGLRIEALTGALLGLVLLWALSPQAGAGTAAAPSPHGARRNAFAATGLLILCFVVDECLPGASPAYRAFNWIPFKAHLQNPVLGIEALLKSLWLAAGLAAGAVLLAPAGRWRLALGGALLLGAAGFALELNQIRLPGRTPDVTGPLVMALACLVAFASVGVLRRGQPAR